jgi:hypothetical protein
MATLQLSAMIARSEKGSWTQLTENTFQALLVI